MAKTVVFESEKLEKRQKLMRLLLPLAVLAAVILIGVIIAVIVSRNKGKTQTGGEDTLYPYSWAEKRDGSLVFRLPETKTEGYSWKMTNSEEAVADVSAEEKPPKGQTGYVVLPKAEGRTLMSLRLAESGENARGGSLYELAVVLDVISDSGKLKATLFSAGSNELSGVIAGGEDEGWPYQIVASGPRELTVYLKDRMKEIEGGQDADIATDLPAGVTVPEPSTNASSFVMNSWDCTSSNNAVVRVIGVQGADGLVTVRLDVPAQGESAQVVLRSEDGGAELTFTVKRTENGSIRIEDNKLTVFEPVLESFEEGGAEAVVTEAAANP